MRAQSVWKTRFQGGGNDVRRSAHIAMEPRGTDGLSPDGDIARRHRDVAGCVFHSDRGSQFRARKVHRVLRHHSMIGSMGNVGTAADNAAMESFFALLQNNLLNTRRWATRDQLRIAIITWIERTYHQRRRQTRLGRLTPTEYETIMTPTTALAA